MKISEFINNYENFMEFIVMISSPKVIYNDINLTKEYSNITVLIPPFKECQIDKFLHVVEFILKFKDLKRHCVEIT